MEIDCYKSKKQKILEANGCVFRGQELLANHEDDTSRECYCGRLRIQDDAITSAKIVPFDPKDLFPEAKAQWELLGRRIEALEEFDKSHPIWKRFSVIPVIGWVYRDIRLKRVLAA